MSACPKGLCDGSGRIAPRPSTVSADAGLDDPCPCGAGIKVEALALSPLAAAWSKADRDEAERLAKHAALEDAVRAVEVATRQARRSLEAAHRAGPRPAKEAP